MTAPTLTELIASKRAARSAAIDTLVDAARARGSTADRSFWTMVHDFERAPTTTNRKQLAEIGLAIPTEVPDPDVLAVLATIVHGLATLRIYLLNTNHLTDRQLLDRLNFDVLDEEVRDTSFAEEVQEWVDLSVLERSAEIFNAFYGPDGPREGVAFPSDRDSSLPRPDDKPSHHQP